MLTDFTPRSPLYGLRFGEFDELPKAIKKKLVKQSLDMSPYTDTAGGHAAIERLFVECNVAQIGCGGKGN